MKESVIKVFRKDDAIFVKKNNQAIFNVKVNEENFFYNNLNASNLTKLEKNLVIERFQELAKNKIDKELDGVEDTEVDENKILQPYDPDKVKYSLKLFSVLNLYNYMSGYDGTEEPTINLNPEFQRNFVWNNRAKSLLVESMLLNIPIPSIYLNQSSLETYLPADGLQRLNTINEFLSGKLRLTGLEYLSDYNGYRYKGIKDTDKELPINIKRKIRDYQITCFVIEKETPDKVKLDIFKRLNSTGMRLSQQELRNSITTKEIRDMYAYVEKIDIFNTLIEKNVNVNRFVHHEFILRFIGAYLWQVKNELEYKGNMNSFLDDVIVFMKEQDMLYVNEVIEQFITVLTKAYYLFGEDAFRKPYEKRKGPLNTVLFSQILINLIDIEITNDIDKSYLKKDFDKFLLEQNEFMLSISSATNNIKNITIANEHIKKFLINSL